MSNKPQEILETLSLLDPADDDHWTMEGLPRLGALNALGLTGVTKSDIQAVAPLFKRENAVLPEIEEEPSIEDRLLEITMEREAAQADLLAAQQTRSEAEKRVTMAAARLEELRQHVLALDTRTDTEINQDLLKKNFEERLKKAGDYNVAKDLLIQAGLSHQVKTLTASPIDRAIAQRILQERRKAGNRTR